jgi:hypothetical protein
LANERKHMSALGTGRTGKRVLLAVCVLCVAAGVVTWLLSRRPDREPGPTEAATAWAAPATPAQAPPPGEDALEKVIAELPEPDIKWPENPSAVDIGEARKAWLAQENQAVDAISEETFEQTLDMSGDHGSNYYMLVLQNDPSATTPDGIVMIVHSRRFAKLLEETKDGLTDAQVASVAQRLDADVLQWAKLSHDGQSLRASSITFGGPNYKTEDLLFPLTFRMNVAILLLGERSARGGLTSVLKSVDVTGVDTNWSACAYACDKIMTAAAKDALPAGQAAVIASYRKWKSGLENKRFEEYKVVEFPSYRSAQRPNERATSTGLPVDTDKGTVSVEMPPIYDVVLLQQPMDGSPYLDMTGTTTDIAKRIVEYARQFDAAE